MTKTGPPGGRTGGGGPVAGVLGGRASSALALAWPAFRDVLARHATEVRAGLADPPQTNEVGRAAPLIGGLLAVAAATGLPARLLETGASAGLNLRADHYRLPFDGGGHGPDSPVVLPDAWRGAPPAAVPLRIAARLGCDLAPLDAAAPEARLPRKRTSRAPRC
ncbi:DUF2332 family protein [Actinomadura montaniterrae]|uniref:DUF2332 family protein n=1 Tax=Actinomadura montaniterrae TaxID=1803903 RepID=UPI001CEF9F57|nr:DUF2332 family protein [Actinomadura montaniterrae]